MARLRTQLTALRRLLPPPDDRPRPLLWVMYGDVPAWAEARIEADLERLRAERPHLIGVVTVEHREGVVWAEVGARHGHEPTVLRVTPDGCEEVAARPAPSVEVPAPEPERPRREALWRKKKRQREEQRAARKRRREQQEATKGDEE